MTTTDTTSVDIPEQGQLVQVRQRRYVVTNIVGSTLPISPLAGDGKPQHLATLASVENDARLHEMHIELDDLYAHLYGLARDELAYILDTFPIVRRKDEARYGEYRTKRMVLDAYERLESRMR